GLSRSGSRGGFQHGAALTHCQRRWQLRVRGRRGVCLSRRAHRRAEVARTGGYHEGRYAEKDSRRIYHGETRIGSALQGVPAQDEPAGVRRTTALEELQGGYHGPLLARIETLAYA